ncbi:hypothetical protein VTN96DRAFT_421 [Rasamsonia emersonii]
MRQAYHTTGELRKVLMGGLQTRLVYHGFKITSSHIQMLGQRVKYRLLVLDGHRSHLTPQFDRICAQNNIIPICMPPHSSHLLQPLDVSCFAVLKRAYVRLMGNNMLLGINHIDKLDFLEAYPKAHTEAFKSENIKNGFAATGLVPFQPDRVLQQLNIQLKTPTPPGSRAGTIPTNWVPETPHNIVDYSIKQLRSRPPPSPTDAALNQLIKGCQLAMNKCCHSCKGKSRSTGCK